MKNVFEGIKNRELEKVDGRYEELDTLVMEMSTANFFNEFDQCLGELAKECNPESGDKTLLELFSSLSLYKGVLLSEARIAKFEEIVPVAREMYGKDFKTPDSLISHLLEEMENLEEVRKLDLVRSSLEEMLWLESYMINYMLLGEKTLLFSLGVTPEEAHDFVSRIFTSGMFLERINNLINL